jgi:hypothetical protein
MEARVARPRSHYQMNHEVMSMNSIHNRLRVTKKIGEHTAVLCSIKNSLNPRSLNLKKLKQK